MMLDDYQAEARKTATYPGKDELMGLVYTALGLAGEAGEFADKVKKVLRDNEGQVSPQVRTALLAELGDVLWYVAMAADELGFGLDAVAQANVNKLRSRQERGVLGGSGDNR